jgi:hypothetical protein
MIRIAILVFLSTVAFGQKKIASVKIENNVVFASVDRPGDLYVIATNGEALKYDKDGKTIGKRKFKSVPDIFDPRDGTRAFAYFRDSQTIETIRPDLSDSDSSPLHPEFAISALMVCPSKNELWILDSADLTLKKTKERGTAIAYEVPFGHSASYMREYLNFLFILDNHEIHVLNNLGKEISKLDINASYFSFLGEELYYPSGNLLELFDLYTKEKRHHSPPHQARFILLTDDRMILIDDQAIEFFEFTP